MALIKDGVIVAPTIDNLTTADMDTTLLEPGFYVVTGSKTIDGQTASIWNVICFTSTDASNPKCYGQIWFPASTSGLTPQLQNIYIRTINSAGTGYGSFTTMMSKHTAAVNKTSYPMELYAQTSQPTASAGKTIIWIDTDS